MSPTLNEAFGEAPKAGTPEANNLIAAANDRFYDRLESQISPITEEFLRNKGIPEWMAASFLTSGIRARMEDIAKTTAECASRAVGQTISDKLSLQQDLSEQNRIAFQGIFENAIASIDPEGLARLNESRSRHRLNTLAALTGYDAPSHSAAA